MYRPNRKNLANRSEGGYSSASMIHPNPRYYKYLWQIYTADSPWEEEAFFANTPPICTHDAMKMIEKLDEAGQQYIVYNYSLPRREPGAPFDFESARWRGHECACAYDDDLDPVWHGFK